MSYQHKPNSGSLFKNKEKTQDKQPDYKGDGIVNGKEVWLSGWINKKRDGEVYLGIKFEEKQPKKPEETPPSQNTSIDVNTLDPDKIDGAIPF